MRLQGVCVVPQSGIRRKAEVSYFTRHRKIPMQYYIYLHGFASSPRSTKARDMGDRFARRHLPLVIPDLNQNDFSHLTLTRQIQQVKALFPPEPTPVTLIGSSFGGLTAAWLGQQCPQVQRLVLLAPAFGFLSHWLPRLGEAQVQAWRDTGSLSVYHYGKDQMLPLHYGFVTDAAQYPEDAIQRPVPTLILHGQQDEVIPITASLDFAKTRPWVRCIPLESDHALVDVSEQIWQYLQEFCQLKAV